MKKLLTSCLLRWELVKRCIKPCKVTQVELHGRYSEENLRTFHAYHATTNWARVLCVCLLTPVPAMLIVILLDCIPLTPLGQGPNVIGVWIRVSIISGICSSCLMHQCQTHVPWLHLSTRFLVVVGIITGGTATLVSWLLAKTVGYPVPFMMILDTPAVCGTVVAAVFWSQREQIRNTPQAFRQMMPYLYLLFCQVAMTVIYPLYNHVFVGSPAATQTALVLLLPIVKIGCKIWINRSLQGIEDKKSESIIFNVEVFHALFVSYCMQSASSKRTVLVLILIDLVLMWLSMREVLKILMEIKKVNHTGNTFGDGNRALMGVAMELLQTNETHEPTGVSTLPLSSILPSNHIPTRQGPTVAFNQIVPMAPTEDQTIVTHERVFINKVLQLMYLTEFIVLIEYTEVIVPLICGVYVSVLSRSSNHAHYQFLQGITPSNLPARLTNTSLYMLAEFLSLLLISILLWRRLRFSLLHQLAFVLETRQVRLQTKLVFWVLYIVQNATVHCGADYSFKFEWLRNDTIA